MDIVNNLPKGIVQRFLRARGFTFVHCYNDLSPFKGGYRKFKIERASIARGSQVTAGCLQHHLARTIVREMEGAKFYRSQVEVYLAEGIRPIFGDDGSQDYYYLDIRIYNEPQG